jgi:branched-chain amino acid transport system permease protein
MSMVGGVHTIVGPALGAYIIIFLNSFFRIVEIIRLLAYGLAAILILLFLPGGVFRYLSRAIDYLIKAKKV